MVLFSSVLLTSVRSIDIPSIALIKTQNANWNFAFDVFYFFGSPDWKLLLGTFLFGQRELIDSHKQLWSQVEEGKKKT